MKTPQQYCQMALDMGADHAVVFSIDQIIFDARTLLKCMFGCNDWSKGHTCPSRPGSLTPWEYETILKQYRWGIIIHSQQKKIAQEISFALERQSFLDGFYFSFSMSDCALCGECLGHHGKPCMDPRKARPAFHSVGIDVFKTVRQFDLPLQPLHEPEETQNWYAAVFIE